MIQDALIAHVNRICAPDADAFVRSMAEALCSRAESVTHETPNDGGAFDRAVWAGIVDAVQHFARQIEGERVANLKSCMARLTAENDAKKQRRCRGIALEQGAFSGCAAGDGDPNSDTDCPMCHGTGVEKP